MVRAILAATCAVLFISSASYSKKPQENPVPTIPVPNRVDPTDGNAPRGAVFASAAPNTTVLHSATFDGGGVCDAQGWTAVDGTLQVGIFWHVDDFAGVNVNPGDVYAPIAGTKSLWCGARTADSGPLCSYAALPGYGNSWDQAWATKTCISVSGNLDVSFQMHLDSESGYDAASLEYTAECDALYLDNSWTVLAGGIGVWDGITSINHAASYNVGSGPVRVRLRFQSDGGFSDQDVNYDSHSGPVLIDDLAVEGLALETFEDEAVGNVSSNDWQAEIPSPYGTHIALFRGSTLLQQDVCAKNLSCVWAAIAGSTETYACGGFPQQAAVPTGNEFGQYLNNEIWSPLIPITGSGSVVNFRFAVYSELTLNDLMVYVWSVRSISAAGCPGPWRDRNFANFGIFRTWITSTNPVGDLIDLATATHMQVRLGVIDNCPQWCGVFGDPSCHSHTPLFDNVKVYRVDIVGPVWSTRDIDMFQDTFPVDGTDTGIGRADAALSISASVSPTILPGDSARVIVSDPITRVAGNMSGLATDILGGNNGDKACYLYVNVSDNGVFNPAKSGAILSGGPLYPFKDTVVADGRTWTRIQCWLRIPSTATFVVDLNDNLFEAGDAISFFFGATNTLGQTSYCSGSALTYVQSNLDEAAANASEFTILPLNGGSTTNVLYVDGMDGRGAQVYWDTALQQIGVTPDRYDVRGPTSSVSNRPGSRVTNVAAQLNANYRAILWDAGDLTQSLGDGTGAPEKSNDYAMVNQFLAGLSLPGGLYVCGDDYPAGLITAAGASAVTFKTTFVTYALVSGNHRTAYGVAPVGVGFTGGAFSGDTFIIQGGCPLLNDFDVMAHTGSSLKQVAYNAEGNNAAVVSKATGNARVMASGFSFIYVRDDEEDGVMDRADHLHDILTYLGGSPSPPTDAGPVAVNRLEQNYPNPFNPQTTIAFSLKARGRVRIDVFDVTGALVRTLLDDTRDAGAYSDIRWDGHDRNGRAVASGVYFYKLVAGDFEQTRKMVLLK